MIHCHLYGTEGCHLCEEAKDLIQQYRNRNADRFSLKVIDIANDEALLNNYGIRIPVLKNLQNNLELDWPFNAQQLNNFMANSEFKKIDP